jgi:hypothetical protein
MNLRAMLVGAVLAAIPSAAMATGLEPADLPSTDGRLTLRASFLSGFPDLVGINGSLRLPRSSVNIEGGFWGFPMIGGGAYLRVGWARSLFDSRDDGRGSGISVEAPLMVGVDLAGTETDYQGLRPTGWVGADVTANLEATLWFARRFGINAEFTIGWMVGVSDHAAVGVPVVRLATGLAF